VSDLASPFDSPPREAHLAALPADLAAKSTAVMTALEFARYQRHMALIGEAQNQCPRCWAYCIDGRIPERHVPGSPCADQDGWPL
jgi:hypothetical protein